MKSDGVGKSGCVSEGLHNPPCDWKNMAKMENIPSALK